MIAAAAVALFLAAADPTGYDALVGQAIASAREGRRDAARASLDRAIALAPGRAEAWIERGGLRFLDKEYDAAIRDLERALAIREDRYARDLLASTLLLTGRYDPAIESWNRVGKPALRNVKVVGLRHAREADVRRELTVDEGGRLEVRDYRRTRLGLVETGFFHVVEMRPVPLGTAPGSVDLEVDVLERHGFGSVPELAGRGIADLFGKEVKLRYANLGPGISIGGKYKWESTQPFLGVTLDAFRPFGFPGMLSIEGLRWRPSFDLEDGAGRFRMRSTGGGVRGRVVVATRTVAEGGLRFRDRTWDVTRPGAPEGTIIGLHLGLDHTFWAGRRHALAGSVRTLAAPSMLGGDVPFTRTVGRVVHHLHVQRPDGLPLEHGSIAVQLLVGYGGDGTPLDEMFAPGAAADMDLPLRAHRQKDAGVLGPSPLARSIALANVEWRQRFYRNRVMQMGYVLFYDGGHMARTAHGSDETLHDVGAGLRLGLKESVLLRADFGYSLTDGKTALTAGIGQVF